MEILGLKHMHLIHRKLAQAPTPNLLTVTLDSILADLHSRFLEGWQFGFGALD